MLDYSKDLKWTIIWQKINFQNKKNELFQPVRICTRVTHMTTSKIVKTSSTFGAFKQIEEIEEIFVEDIRSLLSSPQHPSLSHAPCPAFCSTYAGRRKRWTFVNGLVHLPHEWNFGTPTSLPSPATPLSPLTVTPKMIFSLTYQGFSMNSGMVYNYLNHQLISITNIQVMITITKKMQITVLNYWLK